MDVARDGHEPDDLVSLGGFLHQKVQTDFKRTIYKGCVIVVIKITNGIICSNKRLVIYATSIQLIGPILNLTTMMI